MCGRYASATGRAELLSTFDATADTQEPDEPDFNVAPTKPVPVIVTRPRDAGPVRLLRTMRWGLIPSWAKDPAIGSRLINARIESAAVKPAFRAAASRRRCLLPADGYYEWQPGTASDQSGTGTGTGPGSGSRRSTKQPWFISATDGAPLAMAGLWEIWREGSGADGRLIFSCTVITGDAVDELGHLHDRSPMLIAGADWESWLDPAQTDAEAALALARPASRGHLVAVPVSTAVNAVANNGPALRQPISLPAGAPVLF